MAKKASGDNLHFGAVRLRVTGTGILQGSLASLDDIVTNTLQPLTMSNRTNKEPVMLANLTESRAYLTLLVNGIGASFEISKIVVFVKPVSTGNPQ